MYTNIEHTREFITPIVELWFCEIGGLDCQFITTEYRTRVHCIHMYHLLCNALVHVIYSGVSGQCSHTILHYVGRVQGNELSYWLLIYVHSRFIISVYAEVVTLSVHRPCCLSIGRAVCPYALLSVHRPWLIEKELVQ